MLIGDKCGWLLIVKYIYLFFLWTFSCFQDFYHVSWEQIDDWDRWLKGEGGWPPNICRQGQALVLKCAGSWLSEKSTFFFFSPAAIDSRCLCCQFTATSLWNQLLWSVSYGLCLPPAGDVKALRPVIVGSSNHPQSSWLVIASRWPAVSESFSIRMTPWLDWRLTPLGPWVNWWFNNFVTKHDQFSCAIAIKTILFVVPNSPLTWFKTRFRLARAYGMYVWYINIHIYTYIYAYSTWHTLHISSYLYGYKLKPNITGSVFIKCTNQQKQLRVISQHLCNELHPMSRHFSSLTKPYTKPGPWPRWSKFQMSQIRKADVIELKRQARPGRPWPGRFRSTY